MGGYLACHDEQGDDAIDQEDEEKTTSSNIRRAPSASRRRASSASRRRAPSARTRTSKSPKEFNFFVHISIQLRYSISNIYPSQFTRRMLTLS